MDSVFFSETSIKRTPKGLYDISVKINDMITYTAGGYISESDAKHKLAMIMLNLVHNGIHYDIVISESVS